MTKLPTVSALINEVDNEHASPADNVRSGADNEHASPADNVRSGVEYIGNNVISTEAPTKFNDIFFFGVVKGR